MILTFRTMQSIYVGASLVKLNPGTMFNWNSLSDSAISDTGFKFTITQGEIDNLYYGRLIVYSDRNHIVSQSAQVDLAIKCECGAEKANTTHSNWCPKY